jgi:hypothetical protein
LFKLDGQLLELGLRIAEGANLLVVIHLLDLVILELNLIGVKPCIRFRSRLVGDEVD